MNPALLNISRPVKLRLRQHILIMKSWKNQYCSAGAKSCATFLLLSRQEPTCGSRITSYNVCYTKLLRKRRLPAIRGNTRREYSERKEPHRTDLTETKVEALPSHGVDARFLAPLPLPLLPLPEDLRESYNFV